VINQYGGDLLRENVMRETANLQISRSERSCRESRSVDNDTMICTFPSPGINLHTMGLSHACRAGNRHADA
jgi:hypothetical protein